MRNYLLASAALLGVVAASTAQAATFAPTDPSQNASAYNAPKTNPEPGKIIVRMGGMVTIDAAVGSSSTDKSSTTNAKNSPYGLDGFFRLYFGVDGKLTNGMIYGAATEMRTNFAGVVKNSSGNSTASTWYTRRAYGYVGGATWGTVAIGQGDGPLALFNGISTGEAYDTGQFDGDIGAFFATVPAWAFNDIGNEYVSNKVRWVSPSWSGLQVGLSYAPESVGLWANGNGQASAGSNASQRVSTLGTDLGRPRDMYEIAARWQGNLGPVAVDTMLGYSGSSTVRAATGTPYAANVTGYKDLSVFDFGLSGTVQGFSAFGHVTTGASDGAFTPRASLANGRKKDELAWTAGVQYANGPWTVGTSYYSFVHQGSTSAIAGNRTDQGFGVGGTYNVVPGFDLFASYLWGQIKQSGVNFVDAGGPTTDHNKVTISAVQLTAMFRW